MSHYYKNDPELPRNRREISFRFFGIPYTFISDDGVFSKETLDFGTRVMMETILEKEEIGMTVLDLGCGYGPVGIFVKKYHPDCKVTMVDINERAVELAKENVLRHHMDNTVLVSDAYEALGNETFDCIITNPPIRTGKANIYRMFEQSYEHMNVNGKLFVVIQKKQGAESAIRKISEIYGNCETIGKEKGYFILKAVKNA